MFATTLGSLYELNQRLLFNSQLKSTEWRVIVIIGLYIIIFRKFNQNRERIVFYIFSNFLPTPH